MDEKVMKDGSSAHLTESKRYYVRKELNEDSQTIVYYTLSGDHIPLARAKCGDCNEVIESKKCGDFVSCSCGNSYVDTDRWMPERHRFGGNAKMA